MPAAVLLYAGHLSDSRHQESAEQASDELDNAELDNAEPSSPERGSAEQGNAELDRAEHDNARLTEAGLDNAEQALGELLRRAAAKDLAAWDELVKRFGHLVLHTAAAIGLKHSDAADASQLTWLRLVEHIHEIREPEHLPAWLVVTARREALRIARAARRYVLSAEPDMDYGKGLRQAVIDVYPAEGDYGPILETALSALPSRYEKLIRLLMCDNCPSYTEVARRMSMPIGSIGPMRMRALQLLRRTLEFSDVESVPGEYLAC